MNKTSANIVHNKEGRVVGRIEDRTFVREVHGHKHMLRLPMAWAIDADIFDRVIFPNCYSIHIIDRDTGFKYISGVRTFREKSVKTYRQHEEQYYLELVHWSVIK